MIKRTTEPLIPRFHEAESAPIWGRRCAQAMRALWAADCPMSAAETLETIRRAIGSPIVPPALCVLLILEDQALVRWDPTSATWSTKGGKARVTGRAPRSVVSSPQNGRIFG